MARQDQKMRDRQEMESHQRTVRRNQLIMAVLSVFLILSMVISLFIR